MLTYEQGVAPYRETKRLSESDKAALMGGTLRRSTNGDGAATIQRIPQSRTTPTQ